VIDGALGAVEGFSRSVFVGEDDGRMPDERHGLSATRFAGSLPESWWGLIVRRPPGEADACSEAASSALVYRFGGRDADVAQPVGDGFFPHRCMLCKEELLEANPESPEPVVMTSWRVAQLLHVDPTRSGTHALLARPSVADHVCKERWDLPRPRHRRSPPSFAAPARTMWTPPGGGPTGGSSP